MASHLIRQQRKTSFTKQFSKILLLAFIMFTTANCAIDPELGFSGNEDGDAGPSGQTTSSVVGDNVSQLNLNGGARLSLDLVGGESAVLMMVSKDPTSSYQSFQISPSINSQYLVTDHPEHIEFEEDADQTEEIHEMLRNLEEDFVDEEPVSKGDMAYVTSGSEQIGSKRDFKVIETFSAASSYVTVEAELVFKSSDFNVYVDERDLDDINLSSLKGKLQEFAQIVPREKAIFGETSDVDGNNSFTVLLTREVNLKYESYRVMITGWFFGMDLYDSSKFYASNEMEILYAMVPDPEKKYGVYMNEQLWTDNILPGVLVHEFQHLISYHQNMVLQGGTAEESWLNESLSHLAESLFDYSKNENASRVGQFLSNVDQVCFINCGSTLAERGGGFLFLKYLCQMADQGELPYANSCEELIGGLMDGTANGLDNIKQSAFGSIYDDESLDTTVANFGVALYLSDTGYTSDPLLNFDGINMRGFNDDNRGTVLNGPAVINYNGSSMTEILSGFSLAYLEITGDDMDSAGGELDLQVSNTEYFDAYLIEE